MQWVAMAYQAKYQGASGVGVAAIQLACESYTW